MDVDFDRSLIFPGVGPFCSTDFAVSVNVSAAFSERLCARLMNVLFVNVE